MSQLRNLDAAFKPRLVLQVHDGELTMSELEAAYEVNPTMLHQ